MIFPTIHMNGTSRESLSKDYMEAYIAIRDAMDVLAKAGPNGRDYYPQGPEAIVRAQEHHRDQMMRLNSVAEELIGIVEHVIG
jgi:hypothetical protein